MGNPNEKQNPSGQAQGGQQGQAGKQSDTRNPDQQNPSQKEKLAPGLDSPEAGRDEQSKGTRKTVSN